MPVFQNAKEESDLLTVTQACRDGSVEIVVSKITLPKEAM